MRIFEINTDVELELDIDTNVTINLALARERSYYCYRQMRMRNGSIHMASSSTLTGAVGHQYTSSHPWDPYNLCPEL